MEKQIIFIVFLVGLFFSSDAQNIVATKQFEIVELPNYYKANGILFKEHYRIGIDIKDNRERYTPSIEDIEKAEEVFINKYKQLQHANIDDKISFCCWVRQYVGFIDSKGRKNVILQLINNKKPGKINRLLGKGWETNFVLMLSDNFYAVSARYRVNIDTGEMTTGI
ncbi:hypothetical protein KTO58_26585 [Chitinophaga pendula]|uniref:hypothetical protein n=1 Tax=Chitinophaga TaxID=79328 RepID=UPI000BB04AE8|nr:MULTISPECIES: hypothetical protein [Chitinophaga]ASZ09869.1 hypothetical protein CK934_02180 [Chitinophaga sp. MD30]UCJ07189.1 hypothetical protein KTO58_26585 [Chitinophaga pendula]